MTRESVVNFAFFATGPEEENCREESILEDSKSAFRFLDDAGSEDWILLVAVPREEKAACNP